MIASPAKIMRVPGPQCQQQRAPKSYKQTQIGPIPENWIVSTLGNYASFRTGPFGSALHKSDYTFDGVPIVNPMHIIDGKIEPNRAMTITERAAQGLSEFRLKPGDVVIGRRGDMGRCAVVRSNQLGWLCGTGSMIIRTIGADPNFIQRVLSSPRAIQAIEESSVGTTMVNLNQHTLANLTIQIPPLDEQTAIAEALSDADALIESLDGLIAKKRAIKQGAMQELLTGKRRLPGFKGDWTTHRLGDIGESLIGLTYAPSNVNDHGVLVLRSSNILDGALRFDDNVFVEMDIPERIIVRPGDILICVRNGSRDLIGKCAMVDERCKGMTFGAFMAVYRTPHRGLIHHQFQSDILKRQIHEHLGATINQITNKSLNSFQVPLPPSREEELAIAAMLSDMDAEIHSLEEKLTKASAIKQGMTQELLTGRVRLV